MSKDKTDWNLLKSLLFYFMILVVIFLCIFIYVKVKQETFDCMANPLVYGIRHLSTTNNAPISCSCSAQGVTGILYVTSENITLIGTNINPF